MREFSFFAVFLGIVVGALLAAANAFVGLKVGMTVSASIPAAVVSLLVMRSLTRRGSLLESNIVQTIGSAGESVAAGMIFTLPALFIMGNEPEYLEMVMWGGIGGLLGVCFMVPLRRVLIVKEHGVLPFPEGVACAKVLESGERGGASAKFVVWGAIVGGMYYLVNALGFWKEKGRISIAKLHTEAQLESSPALLGVGYILGPRVAAYMLAGAVLSWFVLIPGVGFFGASASQPVQPEAANLIATMSPHDIYENYIRYIGAGAVAIGGLISLFKSIPTIGASFWQVLSGFLRTGRGAKGRTDRDFPIILLLAIIVGLGYAMFHFKQLGLNAYPIGVIAVIVFTFFFVTVSSRLVGIVGSSSNPVSGMTIATILATALVFRHFVIGSRTDVGIEELVSLRVMCLSIGAIVCIAISVAGDTSQDLKTGFLVKATPYKQQIGEMIGVLTSVVAIAGVILLLNNTLGFGKATADHPNPMLAPQANIMKILIEGVLGGQVPWTLIAMGGATAVIVELLGLPALPFAVGMYLPLGLSTPIMVGGIVHWLVNRKKKIESEHDSGVLTASGLVAGQGLMGVSLAGVLALMTWLWKDVRWFNPIGGKTGLGGDEPLSYAQFVPWVASKIGALPQKWGLSDAWWDALPMIPFVPLVIWLWWCARKRPPIVPPAPKPITLEPPTAPEDDVSMSPPPEVSLPADGASAISEAPSTNHGGAAGLGGGATSAPLVDPIASKFGPPEPIVTAEPDDNTIAERPPETHTRGEEDVMRPADESVGASPAESTSTGQEEEDERMRLLRRIGSREDVASSDDPYGPATDLDNAPMTSQSSFEADDRVVQTSGEPDQKFGQQVTTEEPQPEASSNVSTVESESETPPTDADDSSPADIDDSSSDERPESEIDTSSQSDPPVSPWSAPSPMPRSPYKPKFRAGEPDDDENTSDKP